MTAVADYQGVVTETDVDEAVYGMLRTWVPRYLIAFERERDIAEQTWPRPPAGSYTNAVDEDELTDRMLPAVVVTTAVTDADPMKNGDGLYMASYTVGVRCISRGTVPTASRQNCSMLGAAVRRAMVNQQSLDGFASEIRFRTGRIRPVQGDSRQGRYLTVSDQVFTVFVDNVLSELEGPFVPGPGGSDTDPYDPPDTGDPNEPIDPLAQVYSVDEEIIGLPVTQTPGG